jgi:hypothetical protein
LFSALLSAAVLFLARRSGARSRGNLEAVFGLRLPERLVLWFSLSGASPLEVVSKLQRQLTHCSVIVTFLKVLALAGCWRSLMPPRR